MAGQHLVEVPQAPLRARDRLSKPHQRVLEAVPVATPAATDSIARTAGLAVLEVHGALRSLAGRGLVDQTPTGWRLADGAVHQ